MRSTSLPKTWIFFFVAVMVLVIAALWQSPQKSQIKSVPSETATGENLPVSREANTESMLKNGDNAIYVTDQPSRASKIEVGYVILAIPGFVIIRDDELGMPGKIIGSSSLLSGRTNAVSIDLEKTLGAGQVYYAELVLDDGNAVFEEGKDLLVSDNNKSIVLMSFQASTDL